MIAIERKQYIFKTRQMLFSDSVYDVKGCAAVSFSHCKNKLDVEGFTCNKGNTLVIGLTQDLDAIWGNMGKKSCRYAVKRAQRDGIAIKINQN